MQIRSNTFPELVIRLTSACSCLIGLNLARGQDVLTPSDVRLTPEAASQEALDESAAKASLRFFGLDLFPRAAVNMMYDDNILISSQNPLSDVEWTILPGLTAAAGDLSLYLSGPATLDEIRGLLNYSLLDDSSRPQRFLGVDYSPALNFFTHNSEYNGVDQIAGLSAGYTFSRLAIGLDQDYFSGNVKNNGVGDLVDQSTFGTRLRLRYGLTDRSDVEINGQYHALTYKDDRYEGYQEFRNEAWYNRTLGARLQVGLGAVFGFVSPEASPNQTYEQALLQGLYVVSGKLDVRGSIGIEFRQFDSDQAGNISPVLSLSATYQPRVSTEFSVEAHRREEPSFTGDENYVTLGFSATARQLLLGRLTAALSAGYDNVDYVPLNSGIGNDRSDNYYLIRASLNYEVNRHLATTLFWLYRQDASNVDRYSYTDNMVGVRVNWYY